ncbi:MAG: branched-chain amino acid ABC transporter permease [Chloroflexota bacterium]
MNRDRRLILILSVAVAFFLSVTLWGSRGNMNTLTEFFYLLAIAQLWNLLAGYAGLVSVGQQAWIGLGAYALLVSTDDIGLPVIAGFAVAGVVCGLFAIPTALLSFRLRGGYFAIGTWVIAEVFRLSVTSSSDWLGGGLGRSITVTRIFDSPTQRITFIYVIAILLAFGTMILTQYLMRSKIGIGLTAIRDNEAAAASLGINTYRIKFYIFILCAIGTGMIGGLIALNQINIVPRSMFSVNWTAFMVFIVVIGGIGTIEGPIIGTLVFFLIREYLSDFGEWSFIILGVIAVVMMLLAPQGIWGLIKERIDIEIFPVRRLISPAWLDSMGNGQQAIGND